MTKQLLEDAFSALDVQKKNVDKLIPGVLGTIVAGQQTVEVPNRPGYVYVRLRNNQSEIIVAYNNAVSLTYGLAVLVYRDKVNRTKYQIYARDTGRYENYSNSSAYLPRHGTTHSYSKTNPSGADVVWVYGDQFMPLMALPSGTNGSMNVLVNEYTYFWDTTWHYVPTTGTASLLTYKPTGTSANIVLLYLQFDEGNLYIREGSTFAENLTGTADIIAYLPIVDTNEIPIAGIRLVSGTSAILWDNIYDLRPHFGGM